MDLDLALSWLAENCTWSWPLQCSMSIGTINHGEVNLIPKRLGSKSSPSTSSNVRCTMGCYGSTGMHHTFDMKTPPVWRQVGELLIDIYMWEIKL